MKQKNRLKNTKESDIQSTILAYLNMAGYFAWRVPLSGLMQHGSKGRFFIRKNPLKGFPDIAGILKNIPGKLFVIECKSETGRLKPEQIQWKENLENSGVVYILARNVQTVINSLKEAENE